MDFFTSETWKIYFENRDTKILMLGLDDAGKTTMLNQLRLTNLIQEKKIIGFNPEILEYKGLNLICWDYGGDDRIRKFWKQNYFPKAQGIIYVINSSDLKRLDESLDNLYDILKSEETKESIFLIYLNKQDQENAIDSNEFEKKLNFDLIENRPFKIQTSIATKGKGIYEGLNWLGKIINEKFE